MAKYQVIVTDIGRQKMMDAAVNGQKVKITHIAVGDGGGGEVVPKESWTALTREVWRGEVSSYEIDPEREDGMRVYGIIPASSGGFTIREMGVFDEAGDLIAVSSTAAMQKPSVDSGMSMDMEIYQYILLATVENVEVIIDGNVVGATIQDVKNEVEKHNQDPEVHPGITEKLDSLSDVAFSGSYNDLDNKPTIPSKTTVVNSLTSTSTTSALSAAQGKVLKDTIDDLAPVASSGSYTDLTSKPTIPSVINNLTSTSISSALSAYQGKALKGMIDDAVADSKIVTGIYIGNGNASRSFSLGFKPTLVIVSSEYGLWSERSAIAIPNLPIGSPSTLLSITSTGFTVYKDADALTNMVDKKYFYAAWR